MHLVFVGAIIASLFAVLGVFKPAAWIWALSLLWVFLFGILNYDHHRDRASILNGLKRRDNALAYTQLVDGMLGGLRRMLWHTDAVSDPMPAKGWFSKLGWFLTPRARDLNDLKRLQANTLSWPVMDAALKIAVIYPLFLLLLQWGITGVDTGIGTITALAAEDHGWKRAAMIGQISILWLPHLLASDSQPSAFDKVASWLLYITVAFTVAFGTSFAIAVAFAVAFAGAFAFAVAFAYAFAFALTVALANALALAIGAAVALGVAVATGYGCAKGKGGLSYVLLITGLWGILIAIFAFTTNSMSPERRVIAFAVGLLPLINAVFDYLSYGVTLGLIRYGRGQRNLLTGLIWLLDGLVAVLLLIGLGLGLTGTIALINHLAGQEFIALRPIFDDLKTPEGRAGYTWLTFTLLSTLVPTLVHLVLVFLSAFTWVPQHFKLWIARGIEQDETGDLATLGSSAAAATLGALWAALVTCGLWGIWLFLTIYVEPAGLEILRIVENIALWFGWVEPTTMLI